MTMATCQNGHEFEPRYIVEHCPECSAPQAPRRPLYPDAKGGQYGDRAWVTGAAGQIIRGQAAG